MIIDYKLTYPSGMATAILINSFHSPEGAEVAKQVFFCADNQVSSTQLFSWCAPILQLCCEWRMQHSSLLFLEYHISGALVPLPLKTKAQKLPPSYRLLDACLWTRVRWWSPFRKVMTSGWVVCVCRKQVKVLGKNFTLSFAFSFFKWFFSGIGDNCGFDNFSTLGLMAFNNQ